MKSPFLKEMVILRRRSGVMRCDKYARQPLEDVAHYQTAMREEDIRHDATPREIMNALHARSEWYDFEWENPALNTDRYQTKFDWSLSL